VVRYGSIPFGHRRCLSRSRYSRLTCRVIGAPRRPFETLDQLVEFSSVLGDVALVASELVMNAVLHSGCTTDHLLNVRASLDPEGLLISVQDPGISGTGAKVRPRPCGWPRSEAGSETGRALALGAMRLRGLEPPRPEGHRHLKPARLPIPPQPRASAT
jgi:hypothetical protein